MSLPIVKMGQKTVGASTSSVTVTFATDEKAASPAAFPASTIVAPVCVPSWSTSFYISAVSVTAFTVQFGTATGTGGGTLYWKAEGRL